MFTGLVERQGTVDALDLGPGGDAARLRVATGWPGEALALGDSVAVNGCCVTVADLGEGWFAADLVAETLRRTALGGLGAGDRVNLERPLAAGDRLGGHVVQGHVDGLGIVLDRTPVGDGAEVRVGLDRGLARYVVEKGSIAVDGVSLTVAAVGGDGSPATVGPTDWFSVALIPHTLAHTTLGVRSPGDAVHLEVDVLAKYVERLAAPYLPAGAVDRGSAGGPRPAGQAAAGGRRP